MATEALAGRVAIITGGGSGIGRAIGLRLASEGISVVAADVRADAAEQVLGELREQGADGFAVQVDVSHEAGVAELVQSTLERFGRLDFLVNCAGNNHLGPVVTLSDDGWESVLAVHLTGTFLCCRAAIDPLLESGGRIVNISSNYGFKGRANGSNYAAAKGGIVGLTKVLAHELAPRVNVNVIAPGPIDTPRWRGDLGEAEYLAKKERRTRDVPLGRIGRPDDIAETALFLLGPGSAWMTGQVLHVNGGEFMP
jgi:NAD(P)-dependent dehydrogenase (short-subunit alcohol dehydrogenase family)